MSAPHRTYLDNAATSWPKPESVYAAVDRYQRTCGAPAGRGVYAEAGTANQLVAATRAALARLIGASSPKQIIFTTSGTDALNLAIHGSLGEPGHVITTDCEHNSVLRPLRALADAGRVRLSHVGCDGQGFVDPDAVRAAWQPDTRLVALSHASNVTGAIQPAAEIGALARERGALFLLDAAQTLGELPIDVEALSVDLLAAPGHKGLLGPLGTGLLYIRPGVERQLAAVRQGGTGTRSQEDRQPETLPDKYEAGNLNLPGIVGLEAGLAFLAERSIKRLRTKATQLTERLMAGLTAIDGVRLFGPADESKRVGIVSLTLAGHEPHELAMTLDYGYHVQGRPGLHCAPRMHQALGTLAGGGTLRFSLGCFNTVKEIDLAVRAVREVAAARVAPETKEFRLPGPQ